MNIRLSLIAPRSERWTAERSTTLNVWPVLSGALSVLLAALLVLSAEARGETLSANVLPEKVQRPSQLFPLDQVQILDPALLKMRAETLDYLLSFDSDRLLYHFHVTANIPTDAAPLTQVPADHESITSPFRGHFTGHYLSASAMLIASTGDAEMKMRSEALVASLAKCQQPNGYLAGWPQSDFDKLESGERRGVLWYGMHKILAGLLDQYQHAGNQQALQIARRLGDWADARTARLDREHMQRILDVEFGGIGEALANLADVTGEPRYLAAAKRFDHDAMFRPAARGEDNLTGTHANSQVPKFVSVARMYEMTGDTYYQKAATFFWQQVALHRSFATGATA